MSKFSYSSGRDFDCECGGKSRKDFNKKEKEKKKKKKCDCSIRIRATDATTVTAATFPGASPDFEPADVDIQRIDIDICPKCDPANSNVFAVFQNEFLLPIPGFVAITAASIPGTFKVKCNEQNWMAVVEGLANIVIDNSLGLPAMSPLPVTTVLTLPFRIEVSSTGTATFTASFTADGETLSLTLAGLDVMIRDCDRKHSKSDDDDSCCG